MDERDLSLRGQMEESDGLRRRSNRGRLESNLMIVRDLGIHLQGYGNARGTDDRSARVLVWGEQLKIMISYQVCN